MKKAIISEYKINSMITYRWSPRALSDKPIEKERIQSMLEAARWAPSAFNEQPWRFIIGMKGDETYEKVLETLVEWNPATNGHGTGGGDARDRRNVGRPNSGTESGFGERPL